MCISIDQSMGLQLLGYNCRLKDLVSTSNSKRIFRMLDCVLITNAALSVMLMHLLIIRTEKRKRDTNPVSSCTDPFRK